MPASRAAAKTLTIGSRGSQLALWQARYVASRLQQLGAASRIEIIKTTGDRLQTASLQEAGGKGLFTKEIEEALLSGAIDIAVHSLKDLPAGTPSDLVIAAIPEREDPRDAIVGCRLSDLPQSAHVGTSSGRRAAQLLHLRPDLRITPIRGNVDTRLRKMKNGEYDAILLAVAGLRRLGLEEEIAEILSPDQMCPAAGQGALAIETRAYDPAHQLCAQLNHERTSRAVACERAVLAALGGGCQLPLGVFAHHRDGLLHVLAVIVSLDGSKYLKATAASRADSETLAGAIAADLLSRGAHTILAASQ